MKILVVDDEKLLVKGIKFNLENEGYEVDVRYDGAAALEMIRKGSYDLIILDLMLPGMDGLDICMAVRSFSTVPIIMLTAKSDPTDMLLGFDYGADDYIAKPFNILELKARVRVHLRRRAFVPSAADDILAFGHIVLDPSRSRVEIGGKPVDLTVKEYDLLELLMRNADRVYTREELLELVWGADYQGDIRTVDVHIHRLRDKLEPNSSSPRYIMTKWGRGYYFADRQT